MAKKARKSNEWERLASSASSAAEQAYAPYSDLRVGAALESDDGRVFVGCNVENSSFGLTVCAERVAVCCAVAQGARTFRRLAISTPDAGPLSPCGACRQVLAEFSEELPILSLGRGGLRREFDLKELLPRAFGWPAGEASRNQEE
ncbi:MAG: cytidine deaminase [Armatimonadetes bacterium]|nr:cytidine deaminase [Armatimonadota bacterium]